MKRFRLADLFCGAGGTSAGAVEAVSSLGFRPELTAVNHWPVAIATHTANHPEARHVCTNVDDVKPLSLYPDGKLDLLWASPECTMHSRARQGKPMNDQSRSTAWCVVRWAEALQPHTILVENVPEFETWGGLCVNGRPLKAQRGATFRAWIAAIESLGYRADWRVLCAADYGDPTTRRRLFVQAVRGRRGIVWPEPTHAPKLEGDLFAKRKPWVPARAIIDWSLDSTSIFERKRPLSPKTMARIFEGLKKFGLSAFVVPQNGSNGPRSISEPAPTVTTTSRGVGLAEPFIVCMEQGGSVRSVNRPLPTITTAKGGAMAVVEPFLVQVAHGNGSDANGDARRVRSVEKPLPTVCGQRGEWAVCEPALLPQHAGGVLRSVEDPAPTVTTDGAIALVEPFLIEYYGTGGAHSVDSPLNTVTTKHRHALVRPVLVMDGKRYLLDIRFRMLQPRELAGAQGFAPGYHFTGTKTEQVKQIGNAVPRNLARALCLATLSQRSDITALL